MGAYSIEETEAIVRRIRRQLRQMKHIDKWSDERASRFVASLEKQLRAFTPEERLFWGIGV